MYYNFMFTFAKVCCILFLCFFLLFSQQVLNDLSRKRAPPDYGDSSRLLQRLNGASPVQLL